MLYEYPGGLLAWLLVGLLAGWLSGVLMRGRGYGILWDIVLGLIGAFIGGLVCSFFVQGVAGFIGTILVSILGACILIAIVRAVSPRTPL